ncbi:MAG: aminomethyl-transferring glycine dehydrogenase subunit GcvPA [Pseudomonadales bacterium]|jgi:glycine dehydrogenase subunit 1|nr:aminomethyl-transferring glycine dehydrogenase subunit GcvPA [Pseudomonadales bacterium]MDP6469495.1 aminomethyl-transferring glycine dehydrogenase subunit GcvPA [Pseudomonadales bacterium]MDP6827337.1 aminomethyl-transferring glycine dehydrogenase subunit GcvPA [Pseudomonadales bacterium]MDP6971160.1 aminomethyl-transferring glycine dehydrogenase subunit GcvPA [Pseudomonadales bacterium]|tara:strand:+ start:1826 stop:3199 length:1374 start_codon:yes stop_codon:yes gene_type:complete
MPFIPHTEDDVASMLSVIGSASIDDLFDEIPPAMRAGELTRVPEGMSEMTMLQWMSRCARLDRVELCFAGGGCYDHHIPAAVWDLTQRGEFMTAYTPYQAEASQGTLQLIFEFQTMIASLMGLEVANASVYDGASGLGESVLMAARANRNSKSRRVLVAGALHPHYLEAARSIVRHQNLEVEPLPLEDGRLAEGVLENRHEDGGEPPLAVVVQHPNFFGQLEAVDRITDWAHGLGALVIGVVNPVAAGVLKPPGQWGKAGADIACGDGQPLGVPMASGGPSFGFMCTRRSLVRQMPGRIIGRTEDLDGKTGYALTLQAREQHIRRGKATSNICTNQGLLVTAGTIYMSLLGAAGLRDVALASRGNALALRSALCSIDEVEVRFEGSCFHEFVIDLPCAADAAVDALLDEGILGGVALGRYAPELASSLLVCATEKHTPKDIDRYRASLTNVLSEIRR